MSNEEPLAVLTKVLTELARMNDGDFHVTVENASGVAEAIISTLDSLCWGLGYDLEKSEEYIGNLVRAFGSPPEGEPVQPPQRVSGATWDQPSFSHPPSEG